MMPACCEGDATTSPFEWLTSPKSLEPYLLEALNLREQREDCDCGGGDGDGMGQHDHDEEVWQEGGLLDRCPRCRRSRRRHCARKNRNDRTKRVLHVGSGRSALGEYLVCEPRFRVRELVNADSDPAAVDALRNRWMLKQKIGNAPSHKMRQQVPPGQQRIEGIANSHDDDIDEAEMLFVVANVGSPALSSPSDKGNTDVGSFTSCWPYPDSYFDLIVDKSTLDCTLCNNDCRSVGGGGGGADSGGYAPDGDEEPDHATANFLVEVYRLLRSGVATPEEGRGDEGCGAYLLVTFHSLDFIRPLLLAPGFQWDVQAFNMQRQAETVRSPLNGDCDAEDAILPCSEASVSAQVMVGEGGTSQTVSCAELSDRRLPWSVSGTFAPDEAYHDTVNVLLWRRRPADQEAPPPDPSAVALHVLAVVDDWFRRQNPMLTAAREASIRSQMAQREMPLCSGYEILFAPNERENYTYDLFLEDWTAFCDKNEGVVPRHTMTDETAIRFMIEMQ